MRRVLQQQQGVLDCVCSKNGFGTSTDEGGIPETRTKMTALFTPEQMCQFFKHRANIDREKLCQKLEPMVVAAVNFHAEQIRPVSQRIIDDLKRSNWAPAFDFYSYDFRAVPGKGHEMSLWMRVKGDGEDFEYMDYSHYDRVNMSAPRGTVFLQNEKVASMWTIYSRTDFRKRLLTELGLDAEQFEFKNLPTFVPKDKLLFNDDRIVEYMNRVHIVYKEKRKRTPFSDAWNPLIEAWKSHLEPTSTSVTY